MGHLIIDTDDNACEQGRPSLVKAGIFQHIYIYIYIYIHRSESEEHQFNLS